MPRQMTGWALKMTRDFLLELGQSGGSLAVDGLTPDGIHRSAVLMINSYGAISSGRENRDERIQALRWNPAYPQIHSTAEVH